MAKPATAEPVGTDRGDLKRLLRLASEDPIHAAFAIGGDGKPILMLDKRKQPQALEKGIKSQAPDSKNHRFGSVSVNPDDPTVACFVVNKAASGMAKSLVIALKGTGFKKVRITLDDGTPMESAEGDADGDDPQDGSDNADPTASPDDDRESAPRQPDTSAESPAAGPADPAATGSTTQPTAAAAPDVATLAQSLTGLVKRMLAAIAQDPSQKAALSELATDAQASLKRGDLQQAAAGIEVLRQALDALAGGSVDSTSADPAAAPAAAADPTAAPTAAADPTAAPAADADTPVTPDVPSSPPVDGGDPAPSSAAPGEASGDAQAPQDAAGLTAALTAIVKQLMPIIAADPAQREALKGIVAQAQGGLKNGDLDAVTAHVETLRTMLDTAGAAATAGSAAPTASAATPDPAAATTTAPPAAATAPPAATGPANGAAATYAKSKLVWLAARKKVDGDVGKLHDEMMDVFKDHSQAGDISTAFRKRVGSVMDQLDENLAHKLDEIANNADPTQHPKLVGEAKQHLQRYEAYLANEPLIAKLDGNPFTPLNIHKTMTATLSALGKALG